MENTPFTENSELTVDELISQHMLLFPPASELDDSLSLVQPHAFPYVPNLTTDAALVENTVIETISAQLE